MELDPYYTNLSLYIGGEPPDLGEVSEEEVYSSLLFSPDIPFIFLIEPAIYPLPFLGSYIRENFPSLYGRAKWGEENLIRSLTNLYEESYSLSFFVGRVVNFSSKNLLSWNKGYMGFLVSVGGDHLVENRQIFTSWVEIELKLKGFYSFPQKKRLSWSFRLGFKGFTSSFIRDTFYIGLKRDRITKKGEWYSWIENGGVEGMMYFSSSLREVLEGKLLFIKYFPFKGFTLGLGIGVRWNKRSRYEGDLKEDILQKWELILQPGFLLF